MVALVGFDKWTVKVSSGSATLSSVIAIVIVVLVLPAGIVPIAFVTAV
jgi:hypothetical protein